MLDYDGVVCCKIWPWDGRRQNDWQVHDGIGSTCLQTLSNRFCLTDAVVMIAFFVNAFMWIPWFRCIEKKWTWLGHMDSKKTQWQHFRASTPADVTWPRRKRTTKEPHLEERSWEGDVDSGIQVDGWRNIEAAAQNRAEDGKECSVTSCVHPLRATRLKSILACELSVD